jgi:hypothetical protein
MKKKTALERLEAAIVRLDNDPHTKFVNGAKFAAVYEALEEVKTENDRLVRAEINLLQQLILKDVKTPQGEEG